MPIHRIALVFLLLPSAIAAQVAWTPPVTVSVPLADLGLQGDSVHGITMTAVPSVDTDQANDRETRTQFKLSAAGIRRWLPSAYALLDSAIRLPQAKPGMQFASTLRGDSAGTSVQLGVNTKEPDARRMFIRFEDEQSKQRWFVLVSPDDARNVVAAFATVIQRPVVTLRDSLPTPDTTNCKFRMPRVVRSIPLTPPPGNTAGGRVVLQFVIDSNGAPVDSTVDVMLSTGPEYLAVIKQGFPALRYAPGKCGRQTLPLLVQQGFSLLRR